MKNLITFIWILSVFFTLSSCRQEPTYNPFDDVFEVTYEQLEKDGCTLEVGECGFYWYSKDIDGMNITYHFFDEPVSFGKGLQFPLDTLCLNFVEGKDEQSCLQAIKTTPINKQYIQQKLAKFHIKVERIIEGKDSLYKELVLRTESNKQIRGSIDFRLNGEERLVTRYVDIGIKNEKGTTTNTTQSAN